MNRRELLKGLAGGAGLLALEAAGISALSSRNTKVVEAAGLPDQLPETVRFYDGASESIIPQADKTRFEMTMSAGDILIAAPQQMEIAGNVYGVDSTNHPDQSMVVAVVAYADRQVNWSVPQGIGFFKTRMKSTADRVQDVIRAGQVQASRMLDPKLQNCGPKGCSEVRLVILGARGDGGFDLIQDARVNGAMGLPDQLTETVIYIPQAEAGVRTLKDKTIVEKQLNRGDIWVANFQQMEIAGNMYGVDPTNNPTKTMSVGVMGYEDKSRFTFAIPVGMAGWNGSERTESPDFPGMVSDLNTAVDVQAKRALDTNCTANGCSDVLTMSFGLRSNGSFEPVRPATWVKK